MVWTFLFLVNILQVPVEEGLEGTCGFTSQLEKAAVIVGVLGMDYDSSHQLARVEKERSSHRREPASRSRYSILPWKKPFSSLSFRDYQTW